MELDKRVISLDTDAFQALIDKVVSYVKEAHYPKQEWVNEHEAMRLLNVSSKTTMSAWRSQGKLLYSQPAKKIILYSRRSIEELIKKHSRHTF